MAEFVDSLVAELSPNGALSRSVRTSHPKMEATKMNNEPGNYSPDREERIRRRAHEIWERAGRPENSHEANWTEAAKQIDAELGEETSPAHPETSGSSNSNEPALPDPFAKRGVGAPVSGDSPRPKESGRSDPLKSQ
ncbi:MAG: DUF2934 domain-containing protein [Mesorhizobium sp.]